MLADGTIRALPLEIHGISYEAKKAVNTLRNIPRSKKNK
jgi:hypothetical protein